MIDGERIGAYKFSERRPMKREDLISAPTANQPDCFLVRGGGVKRREREEREREELVEYWNSYTIPTVHQKDRIKNSLVIVLYIPQLFNFTRSQLIDFTISELTG